MGFPAFGPAAGPLLTDGAGFGFVTLVGLGWLG